MHKDVIHAIVLCTQTTKDLANADRRRREEFKRHEMEKKYAERGKLNRIIN